MEDNIQTDEEVAYRRAVMAGRSGQSLDPKEQEMLETFPKEERGAALAFARWCSGQKFKGGIQGKLIAKMSFLQGFRIAQEIFVGANPLNKNDPR